MPSNTTAYKIGDGIELMLEGVPSAVVTPEYMAKTAYEIIKHAIPMAATISPGVIGSIQSAIFKIAGRQYEVKYALRATRVIKAAEIYSQTIDYLEFQRDRNRIDRQIADTAIAHLRQDFDDDLAFRRSVR